jgi:N-acetylglucosaminyl-diphospho-decaprenol L-rhamnosyltransferase
MTADPLVSLVLVTYNSAGLLPAFFDALVTTSGVSYELIAVDNASSDGTAAALAARAGVRLIANRENLGFGRACNQGAAVARGELLVFLNPDVLVNASWLAILAHRMDQRPDAAIIAPQTVIDQGPRTKNQEPRTKNQGPPTDDPRPPTDDPRPQAIDARRGWTGADGRRSSLVDGPWSALVRETAAVPGCAMMIRRAAWEALGGFDEQIFLYWEDTELCWRAWLHGWRVLEDLEATVVHERGGSGGGARWEGEATKNGLYTHLKLLRLRVALPYIVRQALKTAVRLIRGQGNDLLEAWRWNWRGLGLTLAQRRELLRSATGDTAHLERLIGIHAARQRRAGVWGRSPQE